MQIPLIPEYILKILALEFKSGFDRKYVKDIDKITKKGVYAMELLLGMGGEDSYLTEVNRHWRVNTFTSKQANWLETILVWLFYISGFVLAIGPVFVAIIAMPLIAVFQPVSIVRSEWYRTLGSLIDRGLGFLEDLYFSLQLPEWTVILALIFAFVVWLALSYILMTLPIKLLLKKYEAAGIAAAATTDPWEMFEASYKKSTCKFDLEKSMTAICERLGVDPNDFKIELGEATDGGPKFIGFSPRAATMAIGLNILFSENVTKINKNIREFERYVFYNNLAGFFNDEVLELLGITVTKPETEAPFVDIAEPDYKRTAKIEKEREAKPKEKSRSYKPPAWAAFGCYAAFMLAFVVVLPMSQISNNDVFIMIWAASFLLLPVCLILGIIATVKRKKYRVKPEEKPKFNVFALLTLLIPLAAPIFVVLSAINKNYSSFSKYIAFWFAVTNIAFWASVIIAGFLQ